MPHSTPFCKSHNVEYEIIKTDIGQIVFDIRKEEHPCSLCARMRRGALHDAALKHGCNKVALGHHKDDAIETFFMNLFNEGRIGCFSPISYLSRKDLTLIRPLVYAQEKDIITAVKRNNLPIVKSICPADGCTSRQGMKEYIAQMQNKDENFKNKIFGAMQRSGIDRWGIGENTKSNVKGLF
ncbi:MAG: tRNA 2-thiocytidine biosynthesis TtcA family protein [Oscillospiraceae bacterium]